MRLAGNVEVDRRDFGNRKSSGVRDRFCDELHVEVVADGRDGTRLVVTEQVARAANLEVTHGNLEAAAQRGVVANGAQSLVRGFR